MAKKKKEKEIVVRGPAKPVTHPEKKDEREIEKALEEERFGVLQVSHKAGMYFSASMLVSGIMLLYLFTYVMVTGRADQVLISPQMTFSSLAVWIFAGIINILGGLMLMGSE